MKRILIISFSDITNDPRVMRQIIALKDNYKITIAGYNPPNIDGCKNIILERNPKRNLYRKFRDNFLLFFHLYDKYYWKLVTIKDGLMKLNNLNFDLILANEIDTLPLIKRLFKNTKLLVDLHEYYPSTGIPNDIYWLFFKKNYNIYLCKKYLKLFDKAITVSDGLIELYRKNFSISAELIMNMPYLYELEPKNNFENKIKIIYHAAAQRNRKIEKMIEMAKYLDKRFTIEFMLMPNDPKYLKELKETSNEINNIRFIEPVPMMLIPNKVNEYDIGLCWCENTLLNDLNGLPNKFFEYIQGRVCILTGPSPEIVKIMKHHNLGLIVNEYDPKMFAETINSLTDEQIYSYKIKSDSVAKILNYDSNQILLNNIVRNLLI